MHMGWWNLDIEFLSEIQKWRDLLGRPGYRWEDNIKIVFEEIICESVGWIHADSDYGPVANSCEHSNRPYGIITDRKFLDHLSDCHLGGICTEIINIPIICIWNMFICQYLQIWQLRETLRLNDM
jgi:hypothetical protein